MSLLDGLLRANSGVRRRSSGRPFAIMRSWLLILLVFGGFSAPAHAQTNTLIVPQEAENGFGSLSFAPFAYSPFQQVYSATEFEHAQAPLIEITGIAFRLNETGPSLDVIVPRVELYLNIFRGPMSALDRTSMGANLGLDPIMVFGQPNVRLRAEAGQGAGAFDVYIPFERSFLYDRRAGQLVLFGRFDSGTGTHQDFDLIDASFDRGLLIFPQPLTEPLSRPSILATQFSYLPVPEPAIRELFLLSSFLLLIIGKAKG
jgi:hypothetical protein